MGIPPAKIPPRPGGALTGGGGAYDEVAALALLARALDPSSGGRKPAPGTGGAPLPTGAAVLVLTGADC